MKCPGCGADVSGKFCEYCGTKLETEVDVMADYISDKTGANQDTIKSIVNTVNKFANSNTAKNTIIGAAATAGIEAIRSKAQAEADERRSQNEEQRWRREHPKEAHEEDRYKNRQVVRFLIGFIGFWVLIILLLKYVI